jgi:hypothetical protein
MFEYMPFSYMPASLIDPLTRALGPIAVWQPSDDLVPAHMRAAAEKGLLQLHSPANVNQTQLALTIKQYASWADLHKGRSGDLTGFFRSEQETASWMQESAHAIRAQIRSAGRDESTAMESPLFQAALFLGLAHRYDQQQDALNLELRSVASLERRFGSILGADGEANRASGPGSPVDQALSDPGAYMTERRIETWARLAAGGRSAERVFFTTSRAVWESLIERLPEALPASQIDLDPGQTDHCMSEGLTELISALLQAEDPRGVTSDRIAAKPERKSGWTLLLHVLVGCPPHKALARLTQVSRGPRVPEGSAAAALNTIFGYLWIPPVPPLSLSASD